MADSITIGDDIWHAGWKVTLGEARLGQDERGSRTVTINAIFENLSNQTSTFNSRIVLTSGGNSFGDIGSEQDLPNVPGLLSNTGLLAIEVDDPFSLDDATLTIGNPDNNQAIVPIGPASPDTLVSLEPLRIAVDGSAAAGPVSARRPACSRMTWLARRRFSGRCDTIRTIAPSRAASFSPTPASEITPMTTSTACSETSTQGRENARAAEPQSRHPPAIPVPQLKCGSTRPVRPFRICGQISRNPVRPLRSNSFRGGAIIL